MLLKFNRIHSSSVTLAMVNTVFRSSGAFLEDSAAFGG
jgi:hypothetical protein